MTSPVISLADVSLFGDHFLRPECVLTNRAGDIFASDGRGGVSHVLPGGNHQLYVGGTLDLVEPLHPNGIALDRDGSFVLTHLGPKVGGVYRLSRHGQLTPILQELDGRPLTSTNFVLLDTDRLWVTVSTLQVPRTKAFTAELADGYVILIDTKGARVVADGLSFANECRIHPTGKWLYVVETWARRLTRFTIGGDGALSAREVIAEFGPGEYPDGLSFDSEGGAWLTCVIANRVIRVAPDGSKTVMLEEADEAYIAKVEEAYRKGVVPALALSEVPAKTLANVSSLAFGGEDLRTGYFGVLLSNRLPVARLPYAGSEPIHWLWR
jgi:sugar lactone lactonase YvrE